MKVNAPDWIRSWGYRLGLISGGGVGWTGSGPRESWIWLDLKPRPYVLGVSAPRWSCLIRRHHVRTPLRGHGEFGMCSKCYPCPDCGSADWDHAPEGCARA